MSNYPPGMTARDYNYVEGRGLNEEDDDDFDVEDEPDDWENMHRMGR